LRLFKADCGNARPIALSPASRRSATAGVADEAAAHEVDAAFGLLLVAPAAGAVVLPCGDR
jgi:hypothetical protein